MNSETAYKIFKLDSPSSLEVIKKTYRTLALKCHPCRNVNSSEEFLLINQAYHTLLDTIYDASETHPIKQLPPNEFKLELTLNEIFSGCEKEIKIERIIVDEHGKEIEETKTLSVMVKPGSLNETRIRFPKEGHHPHGKLPADVVFIVHELPHQIFKRKRFDLLYSATLTAEEALLGCKIAVPNLDNVPINLKVEGNVNRKTVRRIANRGFPYPTVPGKRGDLIVQFKIIEQAVPTIKTLYVSLNKIFNGCTKKFKVNRKIMNLDGSEGNEDKILKVDIKPGTPSETRITFEGEGNQVSNGKNADVVVIVRDKPNDTFKRDNQDLIYTAQITSNEAKEGCLLVVPTLENSKTIKLNIDGEMNQEGYRIVGKGLPLLDDFKKRGDLVVQFEIMEQDLLIEQKLELSLEEVFSGCMKQVQQSRKYVDEEGNEQTKSLVLEVKIEPGIEKGTRITIPRQGEKNTGKIPADLIFIACDLPHNVFKRDRANLEYTAKVTSEQLINKETIQIPTLQQKETKPLLLDETVNANTVLKIVNCGLPFQYNNKKRGNILVNFEIKSAKPQTKDPDIEHLLPLTLENILNGCTKRIKINRRFYNSNGKDNFEDKIIVIDVKPGTVEGTTYRFTEYGDANHGSIPADVVFVVRDKPHLNFKRNGADIIYHALITETELANSIDIEIPTLENATLKVTLSKPTSKKVFKEKGLPLEYNLTKRGNLIVEFEIVDKSRKVPIKEIILPLSLENILYGVSKSMKIERKIVDINGMETIEGVKINIKIKPGIAAGKKLIFHRLGNRIPGLIHGDVVFVVADRPHKFFVRAGYYSANLKYNIKITAQEAAKPFELEVPSLDGEKTKLNFNGATKYTCQVIYGKGLPISTQTSDRGNILVSFEIVDP